MDQRLIVTMSYVAHVVAGAVLAVAYLATDAAFADGQGTFLFVVGYLTPTIALVLIWARNYVLGPPLYVVATVTTGWFALYFLFAHDNPANVFTVTGDAWGAYVIGAIAVVAFSFIAALLGCWLWYRESPGFRTVVNAVLRPTGSSEA